MRLASAALRRTPQLAERRMSTFHDRSKVNLGVCIVPQQTVWIIERFGKYHRTLQPGLNLTIPLVDQIKYVQSLKIGTIEIGTQTGITKDNVTLKVGGVLFYRVDDPYKASYGIDDFEFAITQLAMSTMRVELGKLSLEATFAEREEINRRIVVAINAASQEWGVECLRYEMLNLQPPDQISEAMEYQAVAERRKRQQVIESEGDRQAEINVAQGYQQSTLLRAEGTAQAIAILSKAIASKGGHDAVALRIAEDYVAAFSNIAQSGTTVLLPADTSNPANFITQALSIYKRIDQQQRDDGDDGAPAVAGTSSGSSSTVSSSSSSSSSPSGGSGGSQPSMTDKLFDVNNLTAGAASSRFSEASRFSGKDRYSRAGDVSGASSPSSSSAALDEQIREYEEEAQAVEDSAPPSHHTTAYEDYTRALKKKKEMQDQDLYGLLRH